MPQARISLTLFRHFSLSFIASGRSSGLHPVSSHSCWMYVRAGRPAFSRSYVGVHRSTSLTNIYIYMYIYLITFFFWLSYWICQEFLIHYCYYLTHSRVFHTSVNWYFSTEGWVTASLLKSLEHLSVIWAIPFSFLQSFSDLFVKTLTLDFHNFPSSLARSKYFFRFIWFFSLLSIGMAKYNIRQVLFFVIYR